MSADVLLLSREWLTTEEIASARGLSLKRTRRALQTLAAAGLVELAVRGELDVDLWRLAPAVAERQLADRVRAERGGRRR